jgi:hypothetical protein
VNHFAYCRRALGRALAPVLVAGCSVALLGAFGCKAGVTASLAGSGGSGNTVGQGGSGGSKGSGGISITGDGGGGGDIVIIGDAGPSDAACHQMDVKFTPTNPTVYLLVDRSGSMFHCLTGSTGDVICADMTNTSWYHLKTAIEQVLPQLESQVRFGFTTVYGTNPAGGGMCSSLQGTLTDNVNPALNNAVAIATLYDSLPFPPNSNQVGIKLESPISESLGNVTKALVADTDPGSKYIILITDGQPDYCDDSNGLCAPDSVVWQLQKAYTAGIPTIVFGIQTTAFPLAPGVLQAFANAGAGEPTLPPVTAGLDKFAFYDQCGQGIVPGWNADLTASGQTPARGDTLGTYSATMGPTVPYAPNATDQSNLVAQLSKALSGVRSCVFDLSKFQIDTTKLNEAQVYLVDSSGATNVLKLDSGKTNGWYMDDITTNSQGMMTATTLELFGPACEQLKSPTTTDIKFNFPCDLVITIDKP